MRLAYVCLDPGVPVYGCKGSSIHCQEVIRSFNNLGYEVELFASRLGRDAPHCFSNIPVHRLGGKLPQAANAREHALVRLNDEIETKLQKSKPFDLVYERYSLWSFAAMQFAFERGIPGILEINAPLVEEQKAYRTLVNEEKAKTLRDKCFQLASSLVAVSDQVAARIPQNDNAERKTTVIPNGVNCEKFAVSQPPRKTTNVVIGFVGTLKPWHGVSILLNAFADAFAVNPEIQLKIVGAGPEEQNLKAQVSEFSQEVQQAVHWLGAIPNDDMPEVLASFDIAVAPYPKLSDFYFSPLKIMEYMAAGCAIVASRIGQIPDLIEHGMSGVLVKPGCQQELANSILRLANESITRKRLGNFARKHAQANHSWDDVAKRILATVAQSEFRCESVS